ncbi:putative LRR containing protein [Trachipleistophora hominis]|uniref:Putative LRR containing protein n=1 Tax=Trachipleistophora hominis TaxID=72359 RepID=L7K0H0_TRAHO|nr:putative LRR containing protein [Trachipleistophora hominis]
MTFITSKGCFEDNPDLLPKFLAIKDKEPKVFVVEMLNNMVNYILRNFLDQKVINTVSTLALKRIAIDSYNCRLLRKLERLKVLQIRTKHITGEVLYNLPPNLELLDITNLFIEKVNWTEKYVIKPSIIIQPYKRLKILVIDVEFLYNVRTLSVLMPSLEVRYSPLITTNPLIPWKKVKINELFIQCDNFRRYHRHVLKPNKDGMVYFLEKLKFYIEFDSLQCVAFVLSDKYIFFDPVTLKIIE